MQVKPEPASSRFQTDRLTTLGNKKKSINNDIAEVIHTVHGDQQIGIFVQESATSASNTLALSGQHTTFDANLTKNLQAIYDK